MSFTIKLGEFSFSPTDSTLIDPQGGVVHLRKQALAVLALLAKNVGQVVEKQAIFDAVWPDVHVSDDSLTQCIAEIRRALAPNGTKIVKTVHRRGFQLLATQVTENPAFVKFNPMIAVFPFAIIGDDAASQQVRDLVADDLTQHLARSESLSVISSLSARRYANSGTWNADIGTLAGVDYVLRGSLALRSGNVLLRMELSELETSQVVWSDVSDHRLEDLVHNIEALIGVTSNVHRAVVGAEMRKARSLRLTDLKSHTIFTSVLHHMYKDDAAKFEEAQTMLHGLGQRDRPEPVVLAADGLWHLLNAVRSPVGDSQIMLRTGQDLADEALQLDPNCILGLSVMASTRLALDGDVAGARGFFERALSFNPNAYKERLLLGAMDVYDGRTDNGLANVQQALRLAANHPYIAHFCYIATGPYIAAGAYEKALEIIGQSLTEHPNYAPAIRMKIVAEGLQGDVDAAAQSAQQLMELDPSSTISGWRNMSMIGRFPIATEFSKALRQAGVPD